MNFLGKVRMTHTGFLPLVILLNKATGEQNWFAASGNIYACTGSRGAQAYLQVTSTLFIPLPQSKITTKGKLKVLLGGVMTFHIY